MGLGMATRLHSALAVAKDALDILLPVGALLTMALVTLF